MFDTIIIGLGAAGYTAAVYAARYRLSTLLIGAEPGGMGVSASEVGNWPGELEIHGSDLMEKMQNHAKSFEEVTFKIGRVVSVSQVDGGFRITTQSGEEFTGKTLILATGSSKRKLGAPGEAEYAGKGVTYCATCDAFFYRGKDVAVIGGGDSAVEGAAIAAQVARRVYLIHRRNQFRAEPFWVERVKSRENVTFVLERQVAQILGENTVTGVRLNEPFQGQEILPVSGVFIEVGSLPSTELAASLGCTRDAVGHLEVDAAMKTSVPGVFGAGDATTGSNRFAQFTTAVGEGAIAANSVFTYLQERGQ